MRTTNSVEHHGQDTQAREVLRCSDELCHPCWVRQYSLSCLDLPQHSTDHRHSDNERRSSRHCRLSGPDIRYTGVPFFWIFTSLISLSAGHTYRAAKHLDLDLGGETLLPTRSTPHANPANPHTNRTKTKTDTTQP